MLDVGTCSVAELAKATKYSCDHLRSLLADGTISAAPRLSPGSQWRIPYSELERLTLEGTAVGATFDKRRRCWRADFYFAHPNGRRERIQRDSPVNTKRGALLYAEEVKREMAAGRFHRRQPATFSEVWPDFIDWAELELKPSTADRYEMMGRVHLRPWFGRMRLEEVGARNIVEYKAAKLATGLSKKTINNHLTCFGSLLSRAVEWKHLDRAPKLDLFTLPKVRDQEFDWLTRDDAGRIVEKSSGYWRPMVVLALNTGMRLGEIEALRWCDLDLKRGVVRVMRSWWKGNVFTTPKSGKPREIPLNPTTMSTLKDHPRMVGCEFVFHSFRGNVIGKSDCHRGLVGICTDAGVRAVGWHVLRHTFASHLVQAGVPLKAVQELLGHSTITMTERYAHLSPDVRREAVMALEGR
jgi:integrase